MQFSTKKLSNLFHIDLVRLSKILEMIQFDAIMFFIALIVSSMLEKYIFKFDHKDITNVDLLLSVFCQIFFNTVVLYYLQKVVLYIPFLFPLTTDYISNYQSEKTIGATIVIGLIFYRMQPSMNDKLTLIQKRFSR